MRSVCSALGFAAQLSGGLLEAVSLKAPNVANCTSTKSYAQRTLSASAEAAKKNAFSAGRRLTSLHRQKQLKAFFVNIQPDCTSGHFADDTARGATWEGHRNRARAGAN